MQTAAISYRVAEFLQRFAPFQLMDEEDLVRLAGRGRVKFHESDEFVYWQGNPIGAHVFVIQQGTVRLLEESGGKERLRDIRGAGDLIGIEPFLDDHGDAACCYLQSAKTASDVILYALPRAEFAALLAAYPAAARHLRLHGAVNADYAGAGDAKRLSETPLFDVLRGRPAVTCGWNDPVRAVAASLIAHAAEAVAIVDRNGEVAGTIARQRILEWAASGAAPETRAHDLMTPLHIAPPTASISDGVLAMCSTNVVALTADGTAAGNLAGLITNSDLHVCFGDRPGDILDAIDHAGEAGMKEANQRARAFLQKQLQDAEAAGWLAELAFHFDQRIAARVIAREGGETAGCWFFYGAAGRKQHLTAALPDLGLIAADDSGLDAFRRVRQALSECGYLAGAPDDESAASLDEWIARFEQWIAEPIQSDIAARRPLFDQQIIAGNQDLWTRLGRAIESAIAADPVFLRLLAHDSLSSLPPLTFFRGLVIDSAGREHEQFELEKHMLTPIADCARVFGLACGRGTNAATRRRLQVARARHPEKDVMFRAADWAFKLALQVQAREGIRHGNSGARVPASALSRHEQQLLKTAFGHIGKLLEFTSATYGLGAL